MTQDDAVRGQTSGWSRTKEITATTDNETYIDFNATASDINGLKIVMMVATDEDQAKTGIYDFSFCLINNIGCCVGINTDGKSESQTPYYFSNSLTKNVAHFCVTPDTIRITKPNSAVPFVTNREYKLTLFYW